MPGSAPGERLKTPAETEQTAGADEPDTCDDSAVPPRPPSQDKAGFTPIDTKTTRFFRAWQDRFNRMLNLCYRHFIHQIPAGCDCQKILFLKRGYQPRIDVTVFQLQRDGAIKMKHHDMEQIFADIQFEKRRVVFVGSHPVQPEKLRPVYTTAGDDVFIHALYIEQT